MEYVVFGVGGMGREVRRWLEDRDIGVIAFVDDHAAGTTVSDLPVFASVPDGVPVVVAIGDPGRRREVVLRLREQGATLAQAIHPNAVLYSPVLEGAMINAFVVIDVDVVTGPFLLANHGATIGHDTRIGAFASLAPGARLLGGVTVGDGCEIGANAVLLPGVRVGDNTTVCAGSVVSKDLPEGVVAAGSPARVIRSKERVIGVAVPR